MIVKGGEKMERKRKMLVQYRGWRTQQEMGDRYGVSQQLWNCWERGKSAPRVAMMKRLEKDSGVGMEELFPDQFGGACNG